jgi:Phage integrase central domain/Arm DNA-binding domain
MERFIYRLTARQVMHLRPPKGKKAARFCDGGNLHLQTTRGKDGHVSRSWTFRYEIAGRRREVGLGPLHDVSLAAARLKAYVLRERIRSLIDPLEAKQKQRRALIAARAKAIRFKECADAYMALHEKGWTRKHATQWRSSLEAYVFPKIGALAPADVDSAIVLNVVKPIWEKKPSPQGACSIASSKCLIMQHPPGTAAATIRRGMSRDHCPSARPSPSPQARDHRQALKRETIP